MNATLDKIDALTTEVEMGLLDKETATKRALSLSVEAREQYDEGSDELINCVHRLFDLRDILKSL